MPLSLAAANGLAEHICGRTTYTAPSGLYLALLTGTIPVQGDSMASVAAKEPSMGGSYARVAINPATNIAAAVGSTIVASTTAAVMTFPTITTGGEVLTGFAVVEAASGTSGRWFFAAAFASGVTYTLITGNQFAVGSGQTLASVPTQTGSPYSLSAYAAAKVLDMLWGKTAWTMPNPPYFAIGSAANPRTNSFTEVAYTGYARTSLAGQMGAASAGVCTSSGTGSALVLPTNAGASMAFAVWGIFEGSAGGTVLAAAALATTPLAAGNTPQLSSGALHLGLV
jgi:hypothetical protein